MNAVKLPNNVQMTALLLDRVHVSVVDDLLQRVKNAEAIALLNLWRQSEDFPFVALAGPLHRNRGVIGGMAKDWDDAMTLVRFTAQRFDQMASQRGSDFTSAWLLFVAAQRQKVVQEFFAETQQTAAAA